uniref:Uncharacterized protein n=1 Tax=Saccharolobus solfataricus (strain ATCC 35092 / DSM 1617 / JCM 11322 / P2) TaxID=273057 RepID=A5GXY2_SACS2|nr:hypothetical protein [Saccharolobus solfataricus]ABA64560.1 hypothetical protein [Saccharolobus solfataricus P2]
MRIRIDHYDIEKSVECVKEFGEWIPYADDMEIDVDVSDVEFDEQDLETIVDQYFDDIVDILLYEYRDELEEVLKNMRSRKINAPSKR